MKKQYTATQMDVVVEEIICEVCSPSPHRVSHRFMPSAPRYPKPTEPTTFEPLLYWAKPMERVRFYGWKTIFLIWNNILQCYVERARR